MNLRHDGAPVVALMRCCWGVAAAVDAAQPESVEPEMTECASGDVALGTLNLLGDAYNPFEFLALDDGDFCAVCDRFEQVLATLTWRDLREAHGLGDLAGALGGGAAAAIAALEGDGGAVLAKMDEVALALDNKRFEHRFNPLVFAMRRFAVGAATQSSDGAAPMVWEIVSDEAAAAAAAAACDGAKDGAAPPWWRVLLRCCVEGGTYAEAPSLLVWDLLCGAVAASDAAAYRRTCEESYLNPRLVDRHAGIFADAVAGLGPRAAVGFQEFPARETARCAAFERAFAAAGLALARAEASSCVLAYRGFGGAAPELVADGCGDIAATVLDGGDFDAKTRDGLATTAKRTFVNRLGGVLFAVVHAKEPKTAPAVELLASYLAAVRDAHARPGEPAAFLLDTNVGKAALDAHFEACLDARGLKASPQIPTTSKRRSRLNGQCYDDRKCHVTVTAAKDKLVATTGVTDTVAHPAVDASTTLPTAKWPSDHALLSATLAP